VREISGGGAHVSVDALGNSVTCRNSISGLRKHGKHIQVDYYPGLKACQRYRWIQSSPMS
jgi:alcohol dehydrogenase